MHPTDAVDFLNQSTDRGLYPLDEAAGLLHADASGIPQELRQNPCCAEMSEPQVEGIGIDGILVGDVALVAQCVDRSGETGCAKAKAFGQRCLVLCCSTQVSVNRRLGIISA